MTDYQQLITYGQQSLDDAITVAEKQIAKMYRESYKRALDEMNALYARLGDKLTLDEANKYKRLENTIAAIAKDYRKVTGKAIELTGDTSAMSMTGAYQVNWFGMEKATGTALQFGILPVDAIRDSVYSAVSGADFVKRFGKLYTSTIDKVSEAITRGLATGQSYAKTAAELKDVFGGSAYNAMRVVRTESQRNLNNGNNAAYERAQALGIEGAKVWLATNDDRTREDHARMNGVEADKDGIFDTPWGDSTGPGDGPADQVIQCRCSTYFKLDGVDHSPDWTFDEWQKEYGKWDKEPAKRQSTIEKEKVKSEKKITLSDIKNKKVGSGLRNSENEKIFIPGGKTIPNQEIFGTEKYWKDKIKNTGKINPNEFGSIKYWEWINKNI